MSAAIVCVLFGLVLISGLIVKSAFIDDEEVRRLYRSGVTIGFLLIVIPLAAWLGVAYSTGASIHHAVPRLIV